MTSPKRSRPKRVSKKALAVREAEETASLLKKKADARKAKESNYKTGSRSKGNRTAATAAANRKRPTRDLQIESKTSKHLQRNDLSDSEDSIVKEVQKTLQQARQRHSSLNDLSDDETLPMAPPATKKDQNYSTTNQSATNQSASTYSTGRLVR